MKNFTSPKRLAALLATCCMVILLVACGGWDNVSVNSGQGSYVGEGKLFSEPTEISMVIESHASWPYKEDWMIWDCFEELTGATFNVQAFPNESFMTKINLMMASATKDLPDLIYSDSKEKINSFASAGALIAIDDYIDMMPNYTAFWNTIPEEERALRLNQRKYSDGKTYFPQNYGTDELQGLRNWLYRKDIFKKHDIQVPSTMEEVYETSKKLKSLYPDSYPFCLRQGLTNVNVMGASWKPYFNYGAYYDFNNDTWSYGVTEPTMLEIVKYMRRMMEDKLIPPTWLDNDAKSWEKLMSTDRGFISCDYTVRVDFFNILNREISPNYTLAPFAPPKADCPTAANMMNKFNVDGKGYVIVNTGDEERIHNAIKLVDWLYTDKAEQMVWGREGESYEVKEDGSKTYIRTASGNIRADYGILSFGTFLRADPAAVRDLASEEQQVAVDMYLDHVVDGYNPVHWLVFTDEEQARFNEINNSLTPYVEKMLHKYLLGDEPISTWDKVVKDVKDNYKVDELIGIYQKAYDRVK